MKTKVIVTAVLLSTVYVVFVNLMSLFGFAQDEVVKVGWYSEFGGSCVIGFYPVYVWLKLPYVVGFYFFATLFFAKVKAHVNKWLGGTALLLWCLSLIPVLVETLYDLYMVFYFNGDEMCRSLENYWETEGSSDYPFMWLRLQPSFHVAEHWYGVLIRCGNLMSLAAFLLFSVVFVLMCKKDKVLGATGAVAMIVLMVGSFPIAYGSYVINLCWIVLCTVILWRLHQSSFDKSFIL